MPTSFGILSGTALARVLPLRGISIGGGTSWDGGSSIGRHLQIGLKENFVDGFPAAPSLQLTSKGFWRFRWTVTPGTRTISVMVRQPVNSTPYPTMIVRKNAALGVSSDVTGTSPGGTAWVTIGPVTVTPTTLGVLWVELWNNLDTPSPAPLAAAIVTPVPCLFGQITTT